MCTGCNQSRGRISIAVAPSSHQADKNLFPSHRFALLPLLAPLVQGQVEVGFETQLKSMSQSHTGVSQSSFCDWWSQRDFPSSVQLISTLVTTLAAPVSALSCVFPVALFLLLTCIGNEWELVAGSSLGFSGVSPVSLYK